jgi:phosphoribosylformylglycinamidine synthase subunit PurQ / glutaminase
VRRGELRVAILSIEGTNCDEELHVALKALGARPEIVHLKQLEHRDVEPSRFRTLNDYQVALLPGGFSAGDYVRAGAIFAARLRTSMGPQIESFVQSGRLFGGICNGFQVLTELGLLPGRPGGRLGSPEAALHANASGHFECRPTFVSWEGGNFPALTHQARGTRYMFPSAHGEGQLVLDGAPGVRLRELEAAGQVLFRWVAPDGSPAEYPWNPNGAVGNVAGLTNPEGNVFGLMPHPERNFFRAQAPDWTRAGVADGPSDGWKFLDAMLKHAERTG